MPSRWQQGQLGRRTASFWQERERYFLFLWLWRIERNERTLFIYLSTMWEVSLLFQAFNSGG
jgi:hypothetical protein